MLKIKQPQSIYAHFIKLCLTTLVISFPLLGGESTTHDELNSCEEPINSLYTEQRPWGSFTNLEEGKNYKVKRIVVDPKKRLSLQTHEHRSEHWVIVQGSGLATVGEEEREVTVNDHIYIAVRQLHRMHNTGDQPLIFIETQCGDYLGEDDIIRYSDDFGRTGSN